MGRTASSPLVAHPPKGILASLTRDNFYGQPCGTGSSLAGWRVALFSRPLSKMCNPLTAAFVVWHTCPCPLLEIQVAAWTVRVSGLGAHLRLSYKPLRYGVCNGNSDTT